MAHRGSREEDGKDHRVGCYGRSFWRDVAWSPYPIGQPRPGHPVERTGSTNLHMLVLEFWKQESRCLPLAVVTKHPFLQGFLVPGKYNSRTRSEDYPLKLATAMGQIPEIFALTDLTKQVRMPTMIMNVRLSSESPQPRCLLAALKLAIPLFGPIYMYMQAAGTGLLGKHCRSLQPGHRGQQEKVGPCAKVAITPALAPSAGTLSISRRWS